MVSRRVDFHLRGNSFSRWKHRQVDCFIAASEAIRQMLVADGVPNDRTVTVHEGIDVGRFDEDKMAFPPGVVIKDFQSDVSQGYPNPKPGGQPARFPTIIQIVPVQK